MNKPKGETMTKICRKCKRELSLDKFWNNKSLSDGKDNTCIECRRPNSHIRGPRSTHNVKYVQEYIHNIEDVPSGYTPLATIRNEHNFNYWSNLATMAARGYVRSCKIVRNANDIQNGPVFINTEDYEKYKQDISKKNTPFGDRVPTSDPSFDVNKQDALMEKLNLIIWKIGGMEESIDSLKKAWDIE